MHPVKNDLSVRRVHLESRRERFSVGHIFEDNPGLNSWVQLSVASGTDRDSGFGFSHSFGSSSQPIPARFSGRHVTLSTFGIGPNSEGQQLRVEFRNVTDVPITFGQLASSFLPDVYVDIVKIG
jgi:hypothetical protein